MQLTLPSSSGSLTDLKLRTRPFLHCRPVERRLVDSTRGTLNRSLRPPPLAAFSSRGHQSTNGRKSTVGLSIHVALARQGARPSPWVIPTARAYFQFCPSAWC